MSEAATPQPAPKPGPAAGSGAPEPQGKPDSAGDWETKFAGQLKVNRDLEQKLNDLRDQQSAQTDALAKAFGLKPEETSDVTALASQVTALQEQFRQTEHTNTVLSIANEHGISDKDDLATLAAITDESAMRRLAARLAPTNTSSTPKPDLTQGGKGGTGTGGSPEADFATFLRGQLAG